MLSPGWTLYSRGGGGVGGKGGGRTGPRGGVSPPLGLHPLLGLLRRDEVVSANGAGRRASGHGCAALRAQSGPLVYFGFADFSRPAAGQFHAALPSNPSAGAMACMADRKSKSLQFRHR